MSREVLENFRFLLLEVIKQAEDTYRVCRKPSRQAVERIVARDDYIDELKGLILAKCFNRLSDPAEKENVDSGLLRAIDVITGNLEHIADYCVNIVGQLSYLEELSTLQEFDYESMFTEALGSLRLVEEALLKGDISLALRICRSEAETDRLYDRCFRLIMEELKKGQRAGDLVTVLFIFRYLERMGDSLLNIGESLIGRSVGEEIKIRHFQAIEEALSEVEGEDGARDFRFRRLAETRSGCKVGMVLRSGGGGSRGIIFKDGRKEKVLREKESFEEWDRIIPGLTPKVIGFHDEGDTASLLVEHLPGSTFQEILLSERMAMVEECLGLILETLQTIWEKTLIPRPVCADFAGQMAARSEEVLKVHPDFRGAALTVCGLREDPLDRLLERVREVEASNPASFQVLIHGDLNSDNVICDRRNNCVYFVDLYRSAYSDYVQDLSVFMVSCLRLPVSDNAFRRRIQKVEASCLDSGLDFAARQKDGGFRRRLALGLARSLFTSTRFELDPRRSRDMLMRAVYLMKEYCRWDERGGRAGEMLGEVLAF